MNNRARRCLALSGGLLASCGGTTPSRPESPLVGNWTYSYRATLETRCASTMLMQVGCSGVGTLEFATAADGSLSLSGAGRAGCQTCNYAIDFGPTHHATRMAVPIRLELPQHCEATIPEPPAGASRVDGTVVCDAAIPGTITLQRR
jgi:hypothetical protein